MKETHTITDLADLKLLSDPLKLSILQSFAEDAKTTRQVAGELNENITNGRTATRRSRGIVTMSTWRGSSFRS